MCERVGNTFDTTAVFNPDLANSNDALRPEPPPPIIRASKSIFLIFFELRTFIYKYFL